MCERNGQPVASGRRAGRCAFTLLEILVVITIIAAVAGVAAMNIDTTADEAGKKVDQYELSLIASAIQQFKADMGQSPFLLAELMQAPNNSDGMGGWWWRARTDAPYPIAANLYTYDPATRRGWNGPYLRAELMSSATSGGVEITEYRQGVFDRTLNTWVAGTATVQSNGPSNRLSALVHNRQTIDGLLAVETPYQLECTSLTAMYLSVYDTTHQPAIVLATVPLGVKP